MQQTDPVAQFGNDATPLAKVGRAMCMALDRGDAVVSIADRAHRRLLENHLTVHGINIVEALGAGKYVPLDAREALSTVVIGGSLDVVRFAEVIGAPIDRAAQQHGCVLIYTDVIPVMYAEGEHTGAVDLERLLRSFIAARPIFVDCR